MGANAYRDVLTIAGCDISGNRLGYSSRGPGIKNLTHQKPDLTAYAHFSGSQVFGLNSPDIGTSAACSVAAGCVAALRSKSPSHEVASAVLFEHLRRTARQVSPHSGWNADYGYGIIDPLGASDRIS